MPFVIIDIKGTFEIEIEDLKIKGLIINHMLNTDFNNDYVRRVKLAFIDNDIIQVKCNLVSLEPNHEISPCIITKLIDSIEKDISYKTIYKDKEVCFCEFQYLLYGKGANSNFDTLEDLLKSITEMNGTYRLFEE